MSSCSRLLEPLIDGGLGPPPDELVPAIGGNPADRYPWRHLVDRCEAEIPLPGVTSVIRTVEFLDNRHVGTVRFEPFCSNPVSSQSLCSTTAMGAVRKTELQVSEGEDTPSEKAELVQVLGPADTLALGSPPKWVAGALHPRPDYEHA